MGGIIDKITDFIKEMLQGWVLSNLDTMFTDVNDKVGTIAGEVSTTPSAWNSGIFNMIKTLSENVIVPIAGMIISFVLIYELIDVEATLTSMFNSQIDTMGIGELIGLGLETMVISLCMKIMSVLITVILYGRMIEIYLYVSVAPIPAATVTNREWGTIGTNYLKGLIALAFQGFFIMVCVAIYAVLVASVTVAGNLHSALWSVAAYTVILCFSLFKTGSLSKSIFNAH